MNPGRTLIVLLLLGSSMFAASGCADQYVEPLPPRDRINYPVGLALHPNGGYLYVVNSNFDTRYRAELGGTIAVVDTDTLEVLAENSPFLPSFGGFARLNRDASRLYVTSRLDSSVVGFEVSSNGSALFCRDSEGNTSSDPAQCTLRRVPDTQHGARLGLDPYGLDVTTIRRTHPQSGEDVFIDLLNITHLRGSQVTTIAVPEGELASATMHSVSLISGGNYVVRRPGSLDYYVAGRSTNEIGVYQPYVNEFGQLEGIIRRGAIELSRAIDAVDARAMAFDEEGGRLYAVTRRPNMLHIIAYEPANPQTGTPVQQEVIRSVPLSAQPSDIVFHRGAQSDALLYVTSTAERAIQVLNPATGAVVDIIELDARPYQLITEQNTARCQEEGDGCRAYVSLFNDTDSPGVSCRDLDGPCGSVAVIDLDPGSDSFHQVIAKIR